MVAKTAPEGAPETQWAERNITIYNTIDRSHVKVTYAAIGENIIEYLIDEAWISHQIDLRLYEPLLLFMESNVKLVPERDIHGKEIRRKMGLTLKVLMTEGREENSDNPYRAVQAMAHYVISCSPTGQELDVRLRRASIAWAGTMTRSSGPISREQLAIFHDSFYDSF